MIRRTLPADPLNEHMHFHVCVVDGVFQVVPGEADVDDTATPAGVIFRPADAFCAPSSAGA